jgi:nucleotide-binding universal stress UspA family protein
MATTIRVRRLAAGQRMFTRILVGIDGSQQSLEAARQAALLQDPAGQLTLFSAWDVTPLIEATGDGVLSYLDAGEQRLLAESALVEACEYIAPYTAATTKLVRGAPVPELLEEIDRDEDTLVAVPGSEGGRLIGAVEGSVATGIIHRAPCSVLVARSAKNGFPRRIVTGVDGSVESAAAYAAARYLAERFDAELHALVAWGGKGVNERLVSAITDGDHDDSEAAPVEALVHAAKSADLLVVGSRGLHGIRALGSVSERVAHTVPCSALVIREASWQRIALELGS